MSCSDCVLCIFWLAHRQYLSLINDTNFSYRFFFSEMLSSEKHFFANKFCDWHIKFLLVFKFFVPKSLFSSSVFLPYSNSVYNSPKCFSGGTENRSKFPKEPESNLFYVSLSIITILLVNHQKNYALISLETSISTAKLSLKSAGKFTRLMT